MRRAGKQEEEEKNKATQGHNERSQKGKWDLDGQSSESASATRVYVGEEYQRQKGQAKPDQELEDKRQVIQGHTPTCELIWVYLLHHKETTGLQGNCWTSYGWEMSLKKAILGVEQENKEKPKKGLLSPYLLETAFKIPFRSSSAERQEQKSWISWAMTFFFSQMFFYFLKRF